MNIENIIGRTISNEEEIARNVLNTVGSWEWNIDTNEVFFSPAWKRHLGFAESEISNDFHEWESRVHPDDKESTLKFIKNNVNEGINNFSFQYRFQHKNTTFLTLHTVADLHHRSVDNSKRLLFTQTVSPSSILTLIHQEIKEDIEKQCSKYKNLVQTSQDGIHILDNDGNLKEWNNAFLTHLGYTEAEAKNLNIKDWDAKYSSQQLSMNIHNFLEHAGKFQTIHRRKDGTLLLVEGYANKIVIEGEVLLYASVHDITEQKRNEQTIKDKEARFHSIISNTSDLIIIVDTLGYINFVTPSIERILGFTPDEVIGKNYLDFVHPDDLNDLILKLNSRIQTPHQFTFPTSARAMHEDGSWRILEGLGRNLIDDPVIQGIIIDIRDITDKQTAKEKLIETTKRLTTLIEGIQDGILFEDVDRKVVLVNQALCTLFNIPVPPSALVGADCRQAAQQGKTLFHDSEMFINRNEEIVNSKSVTRYEELEMVDGTIVERDYIPIFFEDTQQGNLWIYRNITARKRVESELQESRELYRGLSEASFEAIFLSVNGVCIGQNLAAEKMFGYTNREALGHYGTEWLIPEDRERVMHNMKIGYEEPYEATALRKDGSTFPCVLHGKMMFFKGKNVRVTSLRDITKQKEAEVNLQNTEKKFQILLENAPDGITLVKDQCFKYVSPTGRKMFGYSLDVPITDAPDVMTHPDDLPMVLSNLYEIIENPSLIKTVQYRFKHQNGEWIWIESTFKNMLNDPYIDAIVINFRNITEHKLAEHERQRLSTAIEQAYEAILITDPEGVIQYVNPSFEISSGYSAKEIIGQKPSILKSGKQDDSFYNALWKTIRRGKTWKGTIVNKRKDGACYNEEITITPITNKAGDIVNFVAVKRDITNELNLQSQLLQSQKLESMGILAGGVAHDFNNILSIIIGYVSLLESQRLDVDNFRQSLSTIIKASQRGATLVKQLLTFARKSETIFKPLQINSTITEVVDLLRETFPKTISIKSQLANTIPLIYADTIQIHQVLLNLCINARDAMERGGTLFVSTRLVTEDKVNNHFSSMIQRDHVEVIIKDTGVGIEDSVRERIFEPFFTTKELGKGTGLGLSLVYGIVKNHGGIINVKSTPGIGTEFHIFFPVHDSLTYSEDGIPSKSNESFAGTETILLIEDEEMLHSLLKIILMSKGYTVLLATDGIEGFEVYKDNQEKIDVVISDIGLPLLSGEEVYAKIKELNPNAKVILSSGFIEPERRARLHNAGAKHFVSKPYDPSELLSKIRELMDNKQSEYND